MTVSDAGSDAPTKIAELRNDSSAGATVTSPSGVTATAVFAKGPAPSLHLRVERDGRTVFDGELPNAIVP